LDPCRDHLISSTNEEKAAALERMKQVRADLKERGWPEPVRYDSGNGYWLLYRIELPNDEAAATLLEKCLLALAARYDDARVGVDEKVYNAARLCKVPGTWARKGDSTEERPHRRSRILGVPRQLKTVPRKMLEALAAEAPQGKAPSGKAPAPPSKKAAPQNGGKNGQGGEGAAGAKKFTRRLKVEEWLRDRGITVNSRGKDGEGWDTWCITCPFDSSHTKKDACVMQDPVSGKMNFNCFHNACVDNHWQEVKEKIGKPNPEHYDPPLKARPATTVQLGGDSGAVDIGVPEGRTEAANARRLAGRYGEKLRWVDLWGKWLVWNGKRWKLDDVCTIQKWGKVVASALWEDIAGGKVAPSDIKTVVSFCKASNGANGIKNMLELTHSEPGVPITHDVLDQDPWLLNCRNGTLN
jgi:hypothetical protein